MALSFLQRWRFTVFRVVVLSLEDWSFEDCQALHFLICRRWQFPVCNLVVVVSFERVRFLESSKTFAPLILRRWQFCVCEVVVLSVEESICRSLEG